MDQAWQLEEALWAAAATGEVSDYYRHTLSDGATVIGAGYRLRHADVLEQCSYHSVSLSSYSLSDREVLLATGETLILTYRIAARGPDLPADYSAQVTSVYIQTPAGWGLALRQHTEDPVPSL